MRHVTDMAHIYRVLNCYLQARMYNVQKFKAKITEQIHEKLKILTAHVL